MITLNQQTKKENHISVCICTYKRPQLISNLLSKLQNQVTEDQFTYSVVVVDNDFNKSAKDAVNEWKQKSAIQIDYHCEPEQNIALARNKAVENVKSNFIAFIDDDEFPETTWLLNLLKTLLKYDCAGVLGPVKPFFEVQPPQWIIKGRICERPSFPTGTILKKHKETRTGNVLFSNVLFTGAAKPFNPEFGKTGGEDVDFFRRKMMEGFTFRWCDEAAVYEVVPPERLKKKYYIKRALLRGIVNAGRSTILSVDTGKSAIAAILYTVALPFLAIMGQHLFIKYLIKDCDHLGKLIGLFGIKPITTR
jgi:glycosyltransferase involved in cell wall biosynthesis